MTKAPATIEMLSPVIEVPYMPYARATPTPRIAMKINNAKEFVVLISISSGIQAPVRIR
jgi:hypothetical protein